MWMHKVLLPLQICLLGLISYQQLLLIYNAPTVTQILRDLKLNENAVILI
jgi:hypothetical protein